MSTLYVVVANVDTLKLDMWACSDGGTWEVKDAAHSPAFSDFCPAPWCLQRNNLLYVVYNNANSHYAVALYDTDTDTWGSSYEGPVRDDYAHEHGYSQNIWIERAPCCLSGNELWLFYLDLFTEGVWEAGWPRGTAYAVFNVESLTWTSQDVHLPLLQTNTGDFLNNNETPVAAWARDGVVHCIQIIENYTAADAGAEWHIGNTPAYVHRFQSGSPLTWAGADALVTGWDEGHVDDPESYGIRTGTGAWDGTRFVLPHWIDTGIEGVFSDVLDSSYVPSALDTTHPPAPGIGSHWTATGSQVLNLTEAGPVAVIYTVTDPSAPTEDHLWAKQVSLSAGLWYFWLGNRITLPRGGATVDCATLYALKAGTTTVFTIADGSDGLGYGSAIRNFLVGPGPGGRIDESASFYGGAGFVYYGPHSSGPSFAYAGIAGGGGSPGGRLFRNVWDGMVATHPGNCFA